MPEENYTRCPGCATVFRVTAEQLAMRDGQVRCGQCKMVFDGIAEKVSVAPPFGPDSHEPPIDVVAPASTDVPPPGQQATELRPEAAAEAFAPPVEESPAEFAYGDRFSAASSRTSAKVRVVAYALAIVVLAALVAAQAVFHFRDAIASRWPETRPALEGICEIAQCAIRPLRDAAMTYLSIEASDLQADPAHRGLLILTATLRSRASWPLAYPYLELTLTDAQDRVVVRRALAPPDYAGGTIDLQSGIAPNSEFALKLFIDASATSQAGYRLYMFYP